MAPFLFRRGGGKGIPHTQALLALFERTIQEVIAYNCELFATSVKTPGVLLRTWEMTQGMVSSPADDTPAEMGRGVLLQNAGCSANARVSGAGVLGRCLGRYRVLCSCVAPLPRASLANRRAKGRGRPPGWKALPSFAHKSVNRRTLHNFAVSFLDLMTQNTRSDGPYFVQLHSTLHNHFAPFPQIF